MGDFPSAARGEHGTCHPDMPRSVQNTMQASTTFVNIAAYKFVTLDDTAAQRPVFLDKCNALSLKGTILLSPEGINLFLAGTRHDIDAFLTWLRSDARFADLEVKESLSDDQPFNKMLVKLKREIITMKHPLIKPELGRAPVVESHTLKRWLDQGHDDDGKPVVMMDTRNDFEVDVGTFDNTLDYRITKFSEFPDVVAAHREELKDKTVVTFCTGGIRCEKSTNYLLGKGLPEVYHLKGGILKYLEEVPAEESKWEGECFVFDQRVSVGHGLKPGDNVMCHACRRPVTPEGRRHPAYEEGVCCAACVDEFDEARRMGFRERMRQVRLAEARGQRHLGDGAMPGEDDAR